MSEAFNFKSSPSMSVPDLTGIKGFGVKQNEHTFESDGGPCNHCGKTASELLTEQEPQIKPSYFAPQATIIRLGADVAIKVIVQTLIRDEAQLETLRDQIQTAAFMLEQKMMQSIEEAAEMDRDPTPR